MNLTSGYALHLARRIYHRLPLPAQVKWRIRKWFAPLILSLRDGKSNISSVLLDTISGSSINTLERDLEREHALITLMASLGQHCARYGAVSHIIVLPFMGAGGAEMTAINFARAIRMLLPNRSVMLVIADRMLVSEQVELPEGVILIVLDTVLSEGASYNRKQALLRDLIQALRPIVFHNINSEVAWQLILLEGERLRQITHLFGSIFCFQFGPDGISKIGYAAYFFQPGLPYLTGLLSDNQRFIKDAIIEYKVSDGRDKLCAIYNPCRVLEDDWISRAKVRIAARFARGPITRPCVLWAGRLDAQKRVDLFLQIVQRCAFADFEVFGQAVVDGSGALPPLPNLTYRGPFRRPEEFVADHDFDVFLFTSKEEGMPNILLEIGALGIPIIAPTVGGVGELISTETGFPLPERPTVEDYLEALESLCRDPARVAVRAERLVDLIDQRHSWERFVADVSVIPGYFEQVLLREEKIL